MGLIDTAVEQLTKESGRTLDADRRLAELKVIDIIEDINREISLGVLRVEANISVTSGTATVTFPAAFGSVLVFGKKKSSGSEFEEEWKKISDIRHARRFQGANPATTSGVTHYKLVGLSVRGRQQAELVPTPAGSFTAKLIYYSRLTTGNIDKFGWVQPLVNGAKTLLTGWFSGNEHTAALGAYMRDKKKLEPVLSTDPMRPREQRDTVNEGNAAMRAVL